MSDLARATNRKIAKIPARRKAFHAILAPFAIWRIGWLAHAHLKLMLGAVEIDDDESAFHHTAAACDRMRAIAKLVKDLDATRKGEGAP